MCHVLGKVSNYRLSLEFCTLGAFNESPSDTSRQVGLLDTFLDVWVLGLSPFAASRNAVVLAYLVSVDAISHAVTEVRNPPAFGRELRFATPAPRRTSADAAFATLSVLSFEAVSLHAGNVLPLATPVAQTMMKGALVNLTHDDINAVFCQAKATR